jgi:glycosyltransferase involved in cell wall biosynthesis
MKISVVIPAYNSAKTITATLDSVLAQTVVPDEILVLDDGSNDNTLALLTPYKPRITLLQQVNKGVANARNQLCKRATGDLIAFLDHDDIWNSRYLEVQSRMSHSCPDCAAFFTGHVNFQGYGSYTWSTGTLLGEFCDPRIINSRRFIELYNKCPSPFGSMSFCCIPRDRLKHLGPEPFPVEISGADDYYLFNVLPKWGPIAYNPHPLVAYRECAGAQSANRLKSAGLAVKALELLAERQTHLSRIRGARMHKKALASARRYYAKFLMGAGYPLDARTQLKFSFANAGGFVSAAKSLGLLLLTHMPDSFRHRWLARYRQSSNMRLTEAKEGSPL